MPRLTKILEYRRAQWFAGQQNLEELTRQAWGLFDTQLKRTITLSDKSSISGLQPRDFGVDGFAIHCARYTDRQGIGTISMTPAANAEVGERPPESNENFINSDFSAFFRGNHIIVLNAGRNAATLRNFLYEFFRNAGFNTNTQKFNLVRVGNLDKLAMIEAAGVKSIDLNISISEAAAVDLAEHTGKGGIWLTVKRAVADQFKAMIARDADIGQLREAEKGSVTVSINVPKGDLAIAKNALNHMAEALAEDSDADDFQITLRNGQTIKPHEVSVKKRVELDAVANSVSIEQAWTEMRSFMNELIENGQIEA